MSRLIVGALLMVCFLTGCSPSTAVPVQPSQSTGSATVVAERRDLVSVLVVDGTVVALPHFLVASASAGPVRLLTAQDSIKSQSSGVRLATVGTSDVTLPVNGLVSQFLVADGQNVVPNTPIAEVVYSGFGIAITVPDDQLYRIYSSPSAAKVTISSGPSGVDCTLAAGIAGEASSGEAKKGPNVVCLLPQDSNVVSGLDAKVGLRTAEVKDAIVLPVSAVSGSSEAGSVTLVDGTRRTLGAVKLGITDGAYIQIVSGIKVGQRVLAYAPTLG